MLWASCWRMFIDATSAAYEDGDMKLEFMIWLSSVYGLEVSKLTIC